MDTIGMMKGIVKVDWADAAAGRPTEPAIARSRRATEEEAVMDTEGTPIRVMVVDDHAVVREGLRTLLSHHPDISVVGQAGSVAQALAEAETCQPDVVVLDVRLPDGSGVEACRSLRAQSSDLRVLMLTSYADEEAIVGAMLAGASGYLLKDATPDTLVSAIRTAYQGGSLLDPQVTSALLGRMRASGGLASDPWAGLTPQEREVLERVARGETNRQIGVDLHLSEKTVKHYVSNILDKVGVDNRAAAAAWLVERKLSSATPTTPTHR